MTPVVYPYVRTYRWPVLRDLSWSVQAKSPDGSATRAKAATVGWRQAAGQSERRYDLTPRCKSR
jgi:hypothetical protein